jgi:hypothetical protein
VKTSNLHPLVTILKIYELHPLATIFPAIMGDAFAELVADIREHGLRDPITLLDGAILDGRNRAAACHAAGVEPRFEEWKPQGEEDTPERFVFSRNVARRHLTDKQRGEVAAHFVTNTIGGGAPGIRGGAADGVTVKQAAEALGVKPSRVYTERERIRNGGKLNVELKHGKTNPSYVPKAAKATQRPQETPAERMTNANTNNIVPEPEPPIQREIFDWIEKLYERQREILALKTVERKDLLDEFASLVGVELSETGRMTVRQEKTRLRAAAAAAAAAATPKPEPQPEPCVGTKAGACPDSAMAIPRQGVGGDYREDGSRAQGQRCHACGIAYSHGKGRAIAAAA